ncbi:MFS transporter [Methanolacinia petrolearia]|uniref:MFS transporter n=1 Tax=Methanolacinia petrolearia TaxID=54120 RepID=UPI003BA8BA3E
MVNVIYFPILVALQPVLITTLGYSYFQAALLPTMHSLLSSVLQPVFGSLADRKGLRISIIISLLLSGCGIAFLGLVSNHYYVMLGCVAISAMGHATFHPGALCKVDALATPGTRGRLTSLFTVGGNLGQALGPIVGGLALSYGGISSITWLVIPAIAGALVLMFRPIPGVHKKTVVTSASGRENWKPVIFLFSGATLRAWATFGAMTFIPTFLVLEGYSLIDATFLVSVMLLAGVVGQLLGGSLSDRLGRKPVVVATTFAAVPVFAAILVTPGALLILFIILFCFLLWSSFAVTISMAHELVPTQIGLISGMFMGIAMGAGGIGVSVSGIIADHFGLTTALATFPVIVFFAAVMFVLVRYSPEKIKTPGD